MVTARSSKFKTLPTAMKRILGAGPPHAVQAAAPRRRAHHCSSRFTGDTLLERSWPLPSARSSTTIAYSKCLRQRKATPFRSALCCRVDAVLQNVRGNRDEEQRMREHQRDCEHGLHIRTARSPNNCGGHATQAARVLKHVCTGCSIVFGDQRPRWLLNTRTLPRSQRCVGGPYHSIHRER